MAPPASTSAATPDTPSLTVDELAARAGITVRTVRFYSTKGLLPPPVIGPRRVGHYGREHLARLSLIEELQHQGLTLAAIERYLEQLPDGASPEDLAIHRALVASWTPGAPEETDRTRLERRTGRPLSEDDLDRLAAMGVLERTGDPDVFLVMPAVLHLGVRLLEVPFPMETIVATREIVQQHTRAVAHELQELFQDTVWRPFRDGDRSPQEVERMRALTEHIQPVLVQALVTAFQRSLREEISASRSEPQ
ncbi:MerR family transcriptional regulator [Peterkaempfera sp. SMS 1(5)a]|uniref:MerR family transcriptional regulator n=1 Tax=Peterkaempfera podocarpi TaxID=3232308 RepID=UPI003670BCB2